MDTQKIRQQFLNYFKERGHTIVPSSSVVPHDDPTLLFTNAGMNQFKDVFLGSSTRDYEKAASSQKCIRVGGKHNDLENVGHTTRHLTFFEMLGNFSFGDYFKKEAIQFSWEVAIDVFGFDGDRIWPTVFETDDEAFEIWKKYVPENRITRFGKKQNYWAMGETGPCGPCSELLYDRGDAFGPAKNPLEDLTEERYFEFWNLVFMQDNMGADGKVLPLPKPCVDTGAGLERIVDIKIGGSSVFETDVLRGLIREVERISGIPYHKEPAFHVIADHMRCLAFAISDGAQPSNVDRGYVLRKVLRRAVRYARQLKIERPFLGELLPTLLKMMGEDYPELVASKGRIEEILHAEEEAFLRTLKRGGNLLNQVIEEAKGEISGDKAFKLKDTYGLPIDEILLIAKDSNLTVDTKRFGQLEEEAKERSRQVHKGAAQVAQESLFKELPASVFKGYEETSTVGKIVALVVDDKMVDQMEPGQEGIVVLDQTPFYAEKGGQIGDSGTIGHFEVADCKEPYTGVIAHIGKLTQGSLKVGNSVTATIDEKRRQKIANNHTATHLLHFALQEVLGEHIKQAGSVVAPDRLRFDFSHHKALTKDEIRQIEDLVNQKIRENLSVENYEISYEEAQAKREIKQFFGDKYGSRVRVVDIDFSKELCGGTHTEKTGNIGLFRIAKEGSIAAGVRRIEATTGQEAEKLARDNEDLLHDLSVALKTQPQKLESRIEKLLEENRELGLIIKALKKEQLSSLVGGLIEKAELIDNFKVLATEVSLEPDEMRSLSDALMDKLSSGVVVLGAICGERANLLARVSPDLIGKGIKAVDIIKAIAPTIEGGGGGKADSAQAGGKAPQKLTEALKLVRQCLPS